MRLLQYPCIFFGLLALAHGADPKSTVLLHQAIQAQGGEQTLRSLKSVQWEAFGYRNELEESERPEGPYVTEFDAVSEVHDLAGNRFRSVIEGSVYPVFKYSSGVAADATAVMQFSGASKRAGTPQDLDAIREREALSPERLLLTALDAADTHTEPDVRLQRRELVAKPARQLEPAGGVPATNQAFAPFGADHGLCALRGGRGRHTQRIAVQIDGGRRQRELVAQRREGIGAVERQCFVTIVHGDSVSQIREFVQ